MNIPSRAIIVVALTCGAALLIWSFLTPTARPDLKSALRVAAARTLSSFDPPAPGDKLTPAGMIKFEQAELAQVLKVYEEISGRSIIRAGSLPDVKITFSNQTPMTGVEILQALDTVLAAQGITTVFLGTQYVKMVPAKEAPMESAPIIELQPAQLPDSSSYLIYIVKTKNIRPSQVTAALQPFAKMPNSIIAIDGARNRPPPTKANGPAPILPTSLFGIKDNGIFILRDYSSNVRRMLQVLDQMDQP
jgi:type II secretory pathway component GspD/PulD (secretin)